MKKLLFLSVLAAMAFSSCSKWTPLFENDSFEGWESVNGGKVPEKGWTIKDGIVQSDPETGSRGGDIMTAKTYRNFKLKFEFKTGQYANGGIKYFINPGTFDSPSIGFEYQIIDDDNYTREGAAINNVQTTASLYDLLSAHKEGSNYQPYEWNEGMIVVKDGHIEHWLNGVKVLELDRYSHFFDVLVRNSKFRNYKGFGKLENSHILIQDHGSEVCYRNFSIKEL